MVIIGGVEESLLFVKVNSMTVGRITPSAIINIADSNRERGAARSAVTHQLKLTYCFSEVFYMSVTMHSFFSLSGGPFILT